MKIKATLSIAVLFTLSILNACQNSNSNSISKIELGMSTMQVIQELGTPTSKEEIKAPNGVLKEIWFYEKSSSTTYVIYFDDAKVTEVKGDMATEQELLRHLVR